MSRRRATAAVLAVLLLAPAACSHGGPGAGEAHLDVDGTAHVVRADGARETVDDATDLDPGDRVRVTDGIARMKLADGVRFELRAGFADAKDSAVRMADEPELEAGELLVSVPGDKAFSVEAAGTSVAVAKGSARLVRALGVGVAAYSAKVHIDSAGQKRDVPARRQMLVPALGRPPQAPQAITYTKTDPWDQRFLGEAMEIDRTIDPIRTSYPSELQPGEGRTVGYFKLVLPRLADEPAFDDALLEPVHDPADTLIGAAIAQLGTKGSFAERWKDAFAFHADGATWGIVALDQAVRSSSLLRTVEEAIAGAPLRFTDQSEEVADAPTTTVPASTPTTVGGGSSPGGSNPPSPTTPSTTPSTTPPVSVPPPPVPITVPPGPLDPVVNPVVDLVNGLVGGLVGGGP